MSGSSSRLLMPLITRGYFSATYRESGSTVYIFGFGRLDAISAASRRDNFLAGLLNNACDAASIPKTPLPVSDTFIYISRILLLLHTSSIIKVKYVSRPLRNLLLPCQRKTFFATCWLMVDAPRTLFGLRLL